MRPCRPWPPLRVVSGNWSAPCVCRVRPPAPQALLCVECRLGPRCTQRDGGWRSYFFPHSPGQRRYCESYSDSRVRPRCYSGSCCLATRRRSSRRRHSRSHSPRHRSNPRDGPSSPDETCSGHRTSPNSLASRARRHRELLPRRRAPSSSRPRSDRRPSSRASTSGWARGSMAVHRPAVPAERIRQ
jgi:hypothetical protein